MFNIDQTSKGKGRICFLIMSASEDKSWFEVYEAAMLELDPRKLPGRIAAAKEAIQLRLKDIQGDADHHTERQQIEDALNGLRALELEIGGPAARGMAT